MYDQAGSHSSCIGTFEFLGRGTILSAMNGSRYFYCNKEIYRCSVCSADIYHYDGSTYKNSGLISVDCDKWSTENYDSCDYTSGPNLTKYASTMEEYFETYGRPCAKCTGTAEGVTYTVNFNKNY